MTYGKLFIDTGDTHWGLGPREDNLFAFNFLQPGSPEYDSPDLGK